MSPIQQKPILHGRDHCPGGADPIPCMISGPSGDFEGVLLGTGPFAYWRLGETGTPWEDTSGYVGLAAADLTEQESGTALSANVTGALASGDDGALEFNYDGTANGGRYLRGGSDDPGEKDFDQMDVSPSATRMSVAIWAKVKASALSRRGLIIGNSSIDGSNAKVGWGLQVVYPARSVRFTRGDDSGSEIYAETAGGVVVGEWNFLVGTYDGDTIRLYVNGVLVDSTADSRGTAYALGGDIYIGHGYGEVVAFSPVRSWFYGTADEAAVWNRVLSQAEIDAIYTAGVEGAGTGEQVLLSDGAGGTYWGQLPPGTVEPGSEGQVLKTSGGVAAWGSVPGGDPTEDTLVWMPLADSDGTLVLDDDNLIPTLIPI